MAEDAQELRWPTVLRPFAARPRLIAGLLAGITVFAFTSPWIARGVTRALIAWDSGVILFLALTFVFMASADQTRMKRHALSHDEGKHFILLIAIGAAIASVAAIVAELAGAKSQLAEREAVKVGLAAGTIGLSWLFVQVIFALGVMKVYMMMRGW